MKLDTVTKDAIYRPTDIIVKITVAITDGRPDMLLNAVVISDGLDTDAFVVLILNSGMIILCWLLTWIKHCGQPVLEM
jgi:hypothetical protein